MLSRIYDSVKSLPIFHNNTEMEVDGTVPQSEPLDANQKANHAGGFGWQVSDMNRLRRFMCLGSEGGTYYVKEKELGIENAKCIARLIEEGKGLDVVNEVVSFSVDGRAAKQNAILFAFAMCARQDKDPKVKALAYEKLPEVCRIPTHLFMFIEYAEKLSKGTGWGRAHRKSIANWYLRFSDNPQKLAMHVTKYKNRGGWEHRDVLRLSHPKPDSDGVAAIIKYIIKGLEDAKTAYLTDDSDQNIQRLFSYLSAVDEVKTITDPIPAVALIHKHRLVREHLPTPLLNSIEVWRALLQNMPMTAMIRNLSKMTAINLLDPGTDEAKLVAEKLMDPENLKAARIHPFNVLVARKTYEQGHGEKGKLKWNPNPDILVALDSAFYKAFKFVESTNQRYLLAIDISGSMAYSNCNGNSITPRDASAAMAMVTARTERNYEMVGFSTKLVKLDINADMKMDQVLRVMDKYPMGGTDCAQPMVWAKKYNKKFDVFVVYTDCETWAGSIHPAEALRNYRRHSGIWNAKLIVCAMTANDVTLADPSDPGMLDMTGFDSSAPEIMRNFTLGLI